MTKNERGFGEIEYRNGERRTNAMEECALYSHRGVGHPKCNDVAKLETTVELNQKAHKEALHIQSIELSRRLDELNHNFQLASEDRSRFLQSKTMRFTE